VKSPVLLILFNRPDLTIELLRIIKSQTGRRLYIAADGPRDDIPNDISLCNTVVQLVKDFASSYDGECHLQLQQRNLGCGPGVKSALDWFFSHEEMGIILEDDCHPCNDFFHFQDTMLEIYMPNDDIFSVSGSSFLPAALRPAEDIFLTKFTQIWGWGTWRRSWLKYRFQFQNDEIPELENVINSQFSSNAIAFYWMREFRALLARNVPHTWDIQLQFACWRANAMNIAPANNLVTNCGFRLDATHTKEILPRYEKATGTWFASTIGSRLPPYCEELDVLLFWTHAMGMDENRWKYLLLESDFDLVSQLSILAESNFYEMKKTLEWPSFADICRIAIRFFWNKLPGFFKPMS
jgi:hypothetical protein